MAVAAARATGRGTRGATRDSPVHCVAVVTWKSVESSTCLGSVCTPTLTDTVDIHVALHAVTFESCRGPLFREDRAITLTHPRRSRLFETAVDVGSWEGSWCGSLRCDTIMEWLAIFRRGVGSAWVLECTKGGKVAPSVSPSSSQASSSRQRRKREIESCVR